MTLFIVLFLAPALGQAAIERQNWWVGIAPGNSSIYGYYGYPYSYPYYSYYPYQTYWYGYPYSFYNTPFLGLRFGFGHSHDHFRGGHIEHGFGYMNRGHGAYGYGGHHGGRH